MSRLDGGIFILGGRVVESGLKCPQCGRDNPAGAQFCANCGAALREPAPVERRSGLHWGYMFWLWWLAGLVGLGILGGLLDVVTGRPYGAGVYLLVGGGATALLGSLLWMGVMGGLPGIGQRLQPGWRAALALPPLAINGLVGALFFTLLSCDGGFYCGGRDLALSLGIAILFFLIASVGETLAFLLVWGVVYFVRKNSQGRRDRPASA